MHNSSRPPPGGYNGAEAGEALRFGGYKGGATRVEPGVPAAGYVETTWGTQHQAQRYPSLTRNEGEVDILIIGAGITGLLTAYYLAKQGKSVAIIEGRTVGSGQTGRTAAQMMQWNDDWLSSLEWQYGRENTRLIAESHLSAIDLVQSAVEREGIQCDFERVDGYLFPPMESKGALRQLERELLAYRRAGMDDVRMVDLGGDPAYGSINKALIFPRSAQLHPLKLVNGLAEVVTRRLGVKIYEMSHVLRVDESVNGEIKAQSGGKVKAREAVILATGTPINRNQIIHARQQPWRVYALAIEVPKGSVANVQYYWAGERYTWARLQREPGRDLLLICGSAHETGQRVRDYRDTWKALEDLARSRFPQARGPVVSRWSGEVFLPIDHLAFIGPDNFNTTNSGLIPGAVMKYSVTGCSGQGLTMAALASTILGDLILKRPNPYCDLYSPSRLRSILNLRSMHELGRIVTITLAGFASSILPRSFEDVMHMIRPSTIPELKPGEGAVVQEGLRKVAMYRDEKTGKLHRMSALCTHLGSCISWNPMDCTFDCCCHGSLYDRYGRVFGGPSCWDLEDLGGPADKQVPRSVTKKGATSGTPRVSRSAMRKRAAETHDGATAAHAG